MDRQRLCTFLHYGYDATCCQSGIPPNITNSVSAQPLRGSYDDIHKSASNALTDAFDNEIDRSLEANYHLVPLSSGLDSRTILAFLLEDDRIEDSAIHAITFGSPGTWDYEIGSNIANSVGIEHTQINVADPSFDWSVDALREYAKTRDWPCSMIDGYINFMINQFIDNSTVVWSGFMGDPSAGGHQPSTPRENWSDACAFFADHEQQTSNLIPNSFDPTSILPNESLLPWEELSFEEQLDFAIRQQCHISQIVIQGDREQYRFPFINKDWLSTSLNIPSKYRRKRCFFVDIVTSDFPELFSLPSDFSAGLPPDSRWYRQTVQRAYLHVKSRIADFVGLEWTHPNTNYFEFSRAIRDSKHQLHRTTKALTESLEKRSICPWVDIQDIWAEHQDGRDRTQEILTLCSLELFHDPVI